MILDALTSRLETRISRVVTNVAERHGTEQDDRAVCLERAPRPAIPARRA
jgi:hypothetical protein